MLTKVLKILWVSCSVAVLIATLARYTPDSSSDIGIFLVYGMLLLAFPISLLVAALFASLALLQERIGVPLLNLVSSNDVGLFVLWLVFFGAGYIQWFVLLPWLFRKWRATQVVLATVAEKSEIIRKPTS